MKNLCCCLEAMPCEGNLDAVQKFGVIRNDCAALREVLIPDGIWERYVSLCLSTPDEAGHRPISWLAFLRGCLGNLTSPIHHFLIEEPNDLRITKQYKNDLVEKWLFASDYKERFRSSRRLVSRIAELRFAMTLKDGGWDVLSLEARGGKADVEAQTPAGTIINFEIKFLARDESSYELTVDAMKRRSELRLPVRILPSRLLALQAL